MDSTTAFIMVLVIAYPYLLVCRFIRLACRALKVYISNNEYSFYNSDPGAE